MDTSARYCIQGPVCISMTGGRVTCPLAVEPMFFLSFKLSFCHIAFDMFVNKYLKCLIESTKDNDRFDFY